MKLEIVGIHPFDRANPANQGVISDEMVATSVGVTVPEPGSIALLGMAGLALLTRRYR